MVREDSQKDNSAKTMSATHTRTIKFEIVIGFGPNLDAPNK